MIAVTGAAGFIGSCLAQHLAELGERELLLVDRRLTPAKAPNLAGLPGFRFMGHLDFLAALEAGALEPSVIFHLGACSDTTQGDWEFLRRNNLEYTQALWAWCARAGRPFYYASSAATYGDGSRGFSDRTPPGELAPLNLYGKSKNDFDAWALARAAGPAPPAWAGFKFFNVYGPREAHKGRMASVVFHAYRQIKERGEVRLFESDQHGMAHGEQRRDFVFVGDCVEHMLWSWRHEGPPGVYNSGTGCARTFNDLVAAVFEALGLPRRIVYIPMPADLKGRYQSFTQADMARIAEAGYSAPPTPLEEGVRRYVAWLETP